MKKRCTYAVTQALTDFLDSGNWSAASQHLLTFAIQQTQSEYGFLGVILEGPVFVSWRTTE